MVTLHTFISDFQALSDGEKSFKRRNPRGVGVNCAAGGDIQYVYITRITPPVRKQRNDFASPDLEYSTEMALLLA